MFMFGHYFEEPSEGQVAIERFFEVCQGSVADFQKSLTRARAARGKDPTGGDPRLLEAVGRCDP